MPARRNGRETEDIAHRHGAKSAHTLTRPGSSPSSGEPRRRPGTFAQRPALCSGSHGTGRGQTANIHCRAAAGIRAGRSIYRNRSVLAGGSQVPTMDGQLARRDCRIVVQPVVIDQLFMVWESAAAVRLRGARRFVKCGASRSTSRTTRSSFLAIPIRGDLAALNCPAAPRPRTISGRTHKT